MDKLCEGKRVNNLKEDEKDPKNIARRMEMY